MVTRRPFTTRAQTVELATSQSISRRAAHERSGHLLFLWSGWLLCSERLFRARKDLQDIRASSSSAYLETSRRLVRDLLTEFTV